MILFLCLLILKVFSDEVLVFNMTKFQDNNFLNTKKNMTCAEGMTKSMTGRMSATSTTERAKVNSRLCNMAGTWLETPCLLDQKEFCNGFSSCLTDECACKGRSVFYCGDNSGCISMDQVCDGVRDCTDGSDECVCKDYLDCVEGFGQGVCLNADKRQCLITNDKDDVSADASQVNRCFPFPAINGSRMPWYMESLEECVERCPNYTNHCNRIHLEECLEVLLVSCEGQYYDCNKNSNNISIDGLTMHKLKLTKICDGKPDCWNGADEEDCFNRFQCKDNSRSIHISRTCDLVQDCSDGSDECQNCTVSLMYSENHLIGYPFLRYWILFQILFISLCNIWAFVEHFETEKVSKTGQYDRFLCLQLCVYDALMSVYLGTIFVKTLQFYGNYCIHDNFWRTSRVCDFCGSIFSFSSHGSMLTAALMGLSRAYNVAYTFTDMSYSRWVGVCIGMNLANFLNSILPILPVVYIEDFFTVEWFFDKNPINPKATKEQLKTIYMLYENVSSPTSSVKGMLKTLSNMTSKRIYDVSRRLGFYGKSPLCVQNLFSTEPKLVAMKSAYVFVILVIISLVMVSYAVIIYKTKKSAVDVNAVNDAPAAERRAFLSFKVTLVIFTQMICWLPIILATFTTLQGQDIPPEIYEVAAIVSLPINSLINPICHSSIVKKIYKYIPG